MLVLFTFTWKSIWKESRVTTTSFNLCICGHKSLQTYPFIWCLTRRFRFRHQSQCDCVCVCVCVCTLARVCACAYRVRFQSIGQMPKVSRFLNVGRLHLSLWQNLLGQGRMLIRWPDPDPLSSTNPSTCMHQTKTNNHLKPLQHQQKRNNQVLRQQIVSPSEWTRSKPIINT